MPYIGNTAANRFVASKAASVFSGDGSTTAFTLSYGVGSDEDILVSVDGVIQEPSVAYSVSGTTLTFTAAPSSNAGNNIFVYYLFRTVGTVSHPSSNALEATSGTFSGAVTAGSVAVAGASGAEITVTDNSPSTVSLFMGAGNSSVSIGSTTSDPVTFLTNNTEKMRIDANGHVTMPYQSAFSAKITSQQSNIATSPTVVTVLFATELYDQNSDFNTSTYTFTAPVTGRYQLNVLILAISVDSAATYYQTQLTTSNRTYYHTHDPRGYSQDLTYHNLNTSILADMDANDTAIVKIYQSSGTQQTDLDAESYFTGHLVC